MAADGEAWSAAQSERSGTTAGPYRLKYRIIYVDISEEAPWFVSQNLLYVNDMLHS